MAAIGRDGSCSRGKQEATVVGEGPRGEANLDMPSRGGLGGEALEKELQLLEVENRSLTERLSCSVDQQRGKTISIVLWVFDSMTCLPIFSYVGLETELSLSHEAIAQLQKEKEEAEEKTNRVMRDLEGEGIFCRNHSRSARNMYNMSSPCCRISVQCPCTVQGLWRPGEGPGG